MSAHTEGYGHVFTDAARSEGARLAAFAAAFDPFTRARLGGLAVPDEAAVLEIGPGSGSIAAWMRRTWQPRELVLLDRDADLLRRLAPAADRVVCADLGGEIEQPGEFDLIHARKVFMHVSDRRRALHRVAGWLRPGGWLVVGDSLDTTPLTGDRNAAELMRLGRRAAQSAMGSDFDWAATFPAPLRAAGLVDLGVAADVGTMTTSAAVTRALALSVRALLDAGAVDDASRAETALAALMRPGLVTVSPMGVATAWGRRPHPAEDRTAAPTLSPG